MTKAGIICEFNPFHEGHRYLIDSVRRELHPDAVICIMSGNFVQRGEPALWNKWERAKSALEGGADLVLGMPVCVSLSSAQYFAKGSVSIAKGVGCDTLAFGSECGDIEHIKELAYNGIDGIEEGNNILGAEYLRNLDNSIVPWTIKIDRSFGEASKIRENVSKDYVNTLYSLLKYKIISTDVDRLALAPEVSEGLENRIKKAVAEADDLQSLIMGIKSKRYNYTRISRCLMQILLGIERSEPSEPYAHVLAFSDTGRSVIKDSAIKLYPGISPSDTEMNEDLKADVLADDIYSVIMGKDVYSNSDYVCKPYKSSI